MERSAYQEDGALNKEITYQEDGFIDTSREVSLSRGWNRGCRGQLIKKMES
jgi:hypothetical protein